MHESHVESALMRPHRRAPRMPADRAPAADSSGVLALVGCVGLGFLPLAVATSPFAPAGPAWLFLLALALPCGLCVPLVAVAQRGGRRSDVTFTVLVAGSLAALAIVVIGPHDGATRVWAWQQMVAELLGAGALWCVVLSVVRVVQRFRTRQPEARRPQTDAEVTDVHPPMRLANACLAIGVVPACAGLLLVGAVAVNLHPRTPASVLTTFVLSSVALLVVVAAVSLDPRWLWPRHRRSAVIVRGARRIALWAAAGSALLGSLPVAMIDPNPGLGVRLAPDPWGVLALVFEVSRFAAMLALIVVLRAARGWHQASAARGSVTAPGLGA